MARTVAIFRKDYYGGGVDDLIENALDIGEELDAISDDLADVEEFLYSDDDFDDDFYDYDEDDYDDYDDFEDIEDMDDEDDADDVNVVPESKCDNDCFCDLCKGTDVTFDVTCPACGVEIELTEADLNGNSINCPGCNEVLEFEFDDDEDEETK